ncbi:hypothetical protein ADUPG1_013416 [Aduncisulcus paluster]|uniref:GP-PDE domain-containing protein n=1 Tax=Aduncisulcus paluster TaxID=2918883 RepID=A0ABQ5K2V2_9EUKA|nr:hypothetical protein ADUPG1_013416 [Aduncisulcus paluster]
MRVGDPNAPDENTAAALSESVKAGADAVEIDVRTTSDNVLVLLHDSTLDRTTTNCTGPVNDIRYADLQNCRTTHGYTIPTLAQAIDAVQNTVEELGNNDYVTIVLDTKESSEKYFNEIGDLLSSCGYPSRYFIGSFWHDYTMELGILAFPEGVTIQKLTKYPIADEDIATVSEMGARSYSVKISLLSDYLVTKLHRMGFSVWSWTITDDESAKRAIELGVDGLYSDVTSDTMKIVENMNMVEDQNLIGITKASIIIGYCGIGISLIGVLFFGLRKCSNKK